MAIDEHRRKYVEVYASGQQPGEQPNDETAGDARDKVEDCWYHKVCEVLPDIAIRPAVEGDIERLYATLSLDGQISKVFQLVYDREDSGLGNASELIDVIELSEKAPLPIVRLHDLKNSLLFMVKAYKTLLALHVALLVLAIAIVVILNVHIG